MLKWIRNPLGEVAQCFREVVSLSRGDCYLLAWEILGRSGLWKHWVESKELSGYLGLSSLCWWIVEKPRECKHFSNHDIVNACLSENIDKFLAKKKKKGRGEICGGKRLEKLPTLPSSWKRTKPIGILEHKSFFLLPHGTIVTPSLKNAEISRALLNSRWESGKLT